jgi:hypothetical protein
MSYEYKTFTADPMVLIVLTLEIEIPDRIPAICLTLSFFILLELTV